jgi:outer membrane immunogenic protein
MRSLATVLLGATALSVASASIATADDFSARNWAGFYLGLNAGGAWGRSNANTAVNCNVAPSGTNDICDNTGVGAADAAALNASGSGNIGSSGFTGGVQGGYLWQQDRYVYGLETDFGAFKLKGSRQGSGTYPVVAPGLIFGVPYTISSSVNTDWLWTLRGRLGWLVQPKLLAYATGGMAVTRLGISFNYSDTNPGTGSGSASSTKVGWTLGGGLEWALDNHWSVKGEYLYVNFGSVTATGIITTPPSFGYSQGISNSADLTAHVARLGVNYKF